MRDAAGFPMLAGGSGGVSARPFQLQMTLQQMQQHQQSMAVATYGSVKTDAGEVDPAPTQGRTASESRGEDNLSGNLGRMRRH